MLVEGDKISGHFCIECLRFVDGAKASSGNPYKTDKCLMCGHYREGVDSTATIGPWLVPMKTPNTDFNLTQPAASQVKS